MKKTIITDKIAVLFGGDSTERDISIKSGKAITTCLRNSGINTDPIDIKYYSILNLKNDGYTKVFIALHGRGGEDGITQGVLEYLGLPYTGSKVLASSLSMDKLKTKQLWNGINLPIIPYIVQNKNKLKHSSDEKIFQSVTHLGLPLIIKPSCEGSSIGINKVTSLSELRYALEHASKYSDTILVEKYLNGIEYSVAIIGDQVLPSVRIQPVGQFYDYNSKYLSNKTQFFCPSGLNSEEEIQLQKLALDGYKSVGCIGWGRIDIIKDNNGGFYLLEINTSPGMTENSIVPIAAKQIGINFSTLVKSILNLAK